MGESACLLRSFSHPSGASRELREVSCSNCLSSFINNTPIYTLLDGSSSLTGILLSICLISEKNGVNLLVYLECSSHWEFH